MAFGQKKKKEKQEAVFSVFLPLLKALSDDISLTLKLKIHLTRFCVSHCDVIILHFVSNKDDTFEGWFGPTVTGSIIYHSLFSFNKC